MSSPDTPTPDTPTSTATLEAVQLLAEGRRQCLLGYHAWVPWITTTDETGRVVSWRTWCARSGCEHTEQWDA